MKKNAMNINEECWCENWVAPFVRDLFIRAEIKTDEICIYEMDDRRIHICAEVWDDTLEPDEDGDESGGWVDKSYTIRYFEDDRQLGKLLLSFFFYDDERDMVKKTREDGTTYYQEELRYIDEGAYKIVTWLGKPKCIRLKDDE